jgi:hypothetical protein
MKFFLAGGRVFVIVDCKSEECEVWNHNGKWKALSAAKDFRDGAAVPCE